MEWLYENTEDDTARFILGTVGERPLVCVGVNPSTARPNQLDPTVNYVSRLAASHGYDSFIMLNLYAQRATDPKNLHREYLPALKMENERQIARIIQHRPLTVWAAWGGLIRQRPYLMALMHGIVTLPELAACTWVMRGTPTKEGHPHHPLYVKKDAPFEAFNVAGYVRSFG